MKGQDSGSSIHCRRHPEGTTRKRRGKQAAILGGIVAAVGVSKSKERWFEIREGVRSVKLHVDKKDY